MGQLIAKLQAQFNKSQSFSQSVAANVPNAHDYDAFSNIIDDIAAHYILTMNFMSMVDLNDKEYCNKLVILTSDVLKQNLNEMQVDYLEQKINGDTQTIDEMVTRNLVYYDKDVIDKLNSGENKTRKCIGIARYYVKIAHIFAAIMTTINPVYMYYDDTGQMVIKTLAEKPTIPKGVKVERVNINLCDTRVQNLGHEAPPQLDASGNDTTPANTLNLDPYICSPDSSEERLIDEPGIPELEQLYYDDGYDINTGEFTTMSKVSRAQYMRDLQLFYTTFTGIQQMPPNIQSFSDIKLQTYNKNFSACNKAPYGIQIEKSTDLFKQYADHIKNMMATAATQQLELLQVINMLFEKKDGSPPIIRLSSKLNGKILQEAVVLARKIIVKLYVGCEQNYVKGIQLYEAIVESQIGKTLQQQIDNLNSRANDIVSNYATPQEESFIINSPTPSSLPSQYTADVSPQSFITNTEGLASPISSSTTTASSMPALLPLNIQNQNMTTQVPIYYDWGVGPLKYPRPLNEQLTIKNTTTP